MTQSVKLPAVDLYAREALSHWRTLIGKPGCWDVFVARHAEVIVCSLMWMCSVCVCAVHGCVVCIICDHTLENHCFGHS